MITIEIRNMEENDWEHVARIYQQGIDTNLATFESQIPTYEYFYQSHIENYNFVAVENDRIVGWCALSPTSQRLAYKGVVEVSVYIDEDFRGRGVGTFLLNYLVDISEKMEFWTLQSVILQDNVRSRTLHEKCGFRLVGYREKISKNKLGEWKNTFLLERRSNKIF